ncbi:MAG: hypothetical protein C0485_02905 [Pirellula sp.]|nr:hypothetical protein [Pirellula sp.]
MATAATIDAGWHSMAGVANGWGGKRSSRENANIEAFEATEGWRLRGRLAIARGRQLGSGRYFEVSLPWKCRGPNGDNSRGHAPWLAIDRKACWLR